MAQPGSSACKVSTAAALALSVAAGPLRAQQTGPCAADEVVLIETVLDRATRVPLAGAIITAAWQVGGETRKQYTADAAGRAEICAPAGASVLLSVSYRDQRSEPARVSLTRDRRVTHSVSLDVPSVFVRGTAVDEAAGIPIAGVAIRVLNAPLAAVTDEAGRFSIARVPAGDYTLRIEHFSYQAANAKLAVRAEDLDIAISLGVSAIALDPIVVTAFSRRLEHVGYYDRERRGIGTFINHKQIAQMNVTNGSDLLRRVPGVRLVPQPSRRNNPQNSTLGRGSCRFRFIVDGVRTLADFEMDFLTPDALEGIEVYRGTAEVPADFRALVGTDAGQPMCGVIVAWTRVN